MNRIRILIRPPRCIQDPDPISQDRPDPAMQECMLKVTKEKLLICKIMQDSRIFNTFVHLARTARSDQGPEAKKKSLIGNNSGSAKRSRHTTLPSDEDAYLATYL